MSSVIFVGLGGAIGAVGRYLISLLPYEGVFPILTFITNFLGALLIGFFTGLASESGYMSPNSQLFLKTGVCGGFTTFSTFSLEAKKLFENGNNVSGGLYMLLSVFICIVGVVLGEYFGTKLVK